MPRIVCFTCGRQVYTTVSFESLMAEERRCPRCGSSMHVERREAERRQAIRRQNPSDDPGPPTPTGSEGEEATGDERRVGDRRTTRRRRDPERRNRPGTGPDSVGWQD